ncbi:MAG: DUF1761 domain-containing protein [Patescibacteria group bacterium]
MDIVINYWAVLVSALASMAIGMLWYGPVFGKQWMAMTGITKESMKSMALSPTKAMSLGLVSSLIMAYVLGYVASALGTEGVPEALVLAFWIWLGFVATSQISGFLWEGKPLKLFLLNTAYSLVVYGVMALILVLWR